MSDETARQIEYLIEITQQDFEIKDSLLNDAVAMELLVAEELTEIKFEVKEIKEGLFQFFEQEQNRFDTQRDEALEQYFRTLEALREGKRGSPGSPIPGGTPTQDDSSRDGGFFGSNLGNILGLGAVGLAIANFAKRIGIVAAAIGAGIVAFEGIAEFVEQFEKLKLEGFDPNEAFNEAITRAGARVAEVISDNIIEPIANFGLELIAPELGFNEVEVAEMKKNIDDLSDAFRRGAIAVTDTLVRFFGDETSFAQQRQTDERVGELRSELQEVQTEIREAGLDASPGGEIESGLARRQEILTRLEEIRTAPRQENAVAQAALRGEEARLKRELRPLSQRLAPVLEEQRILNEIQTVEERNRFAQAGFAAGDLNTQAQINYQGLSSEQKEEFVDTVMEPELKSAIETGAVERLSAIESLDDMFRSMAPGAQGIPIEINSIDGLMNLSKDQLEAILINDDILNNSKLQTGAMETSDRKIVEYIYRMKTEGAANPNLSPSQSTASPGTTVAGASQTNNYVENVFNSTVTPQQDENIPDQLMATMSPGQALTSSLPVNEMSRNVAASSAGPIVVATTTGGSTVNNMVNNSSTNVLGGGPSARTNDVGFRRYYDKQQATV